MSELSNRERNLVALGAAVASNCIPCVEYHVPGAKRIGLSDRELHEALKIADKVRQVPSRAVLEAALARIDTRPERADNATDSGCGCGAPESSGAGREVC